MRIVADLSRCVGAGQCVLTDATLFDQDDADGTVVLRTDQVPAGKEAVIAEAIALCPGRALFLAPDEPAPRGDGLSGESRVGLGW
ncbi:ferredoxin [Pilimelia columellifera]|uniref:Ferredoxin n=1 Tax=Pilimelia columellifera subsp. columellifera TaxID=706583 RepID=A0ABN3NSR0_9ACTN